MLIAGFDAGQTHTRCRLQRLSPGAPAPASEAAAGPASTLGEGEGSGVSHLDAAHGETRFCDAVHSSLQAALSAAKLPPDTRLDAAVVGASGIEEGTALQQRGQGLLSHTLQLDTQQVLVTGDERTALHAVFPAAEGIVLISGTGMICLGRNANGHEHRCGGWGWRLDGGGSAYDIGLHGLQLSLRMADGRVPETDLRRALWTALDCSSAAAIKALAAGPHLSVADLARLAPFVEASAATGEAQALGVLEHSAASLTDAVCAVASPLALASPNISGQGGAITHLPTFRSMVEHALNQRLPDWRWQEGGGDACDGALRLAQALLRS